MVAEKTRQMASEKKEIRASILSTLSQPLLALSPHQHCKTATLQTPCVMFRMFNTLTFSLACLPVSSHRSPCL